MIVKKIFIIGSGLMGSGIAQVCTQAGIEVFLTDIDQQALIKALKNIAWSAGKIIEKGALKESLESIMGRIHIVPDYSAAAQAELALEAVFEKLEVKEEVQHPYNQYFSHPYYRTGSCDQKAWESPWPSLLQPCTDDDCCRSRQRDQHFRGDSSDRNRFC
jgi:6-phosphogluconate dehydrogenase (decarboxylating)